MYPIFTAYYKYPYNEYLDWNNWNCLYDFIYANQDKVYGRTHLMTSIVTLQRQVLCKIEYLNEITWYESKLLVGLKKINLNKNIVYQSSLTYN